jgi:hypothetical protein
MFIEFVDVSVGRIEYHLGEETPHVLFDDTRRLLEVSLRNFRSSACATQLIRYVVQGRALRPWNATQEHGGSKQDCEKATSSFEHEG